MDWLKDFLSHNGFALLSLILAPALAWFFNRRKQNSDVKKVDAEGTNLLVTSSNELVISWETFAKKMREEYQECIELNNKLSDKVDRLTIYVHGVERYSSGIKDVLDDVLVELEKTNPDFVKNSRKKVADLQTALEESK